MEADLVADTRVAPVDQPHDSIRFAIQHRNRLLGGV
jgi:hypothetical protein